MYLLGKSFIALLIKVLSLIFSFTQQGQILRQRSKFVWAEEQEQAFQKLKTYLTTDTILALPDFKQQMNFCTDASVNDDGAVLVQNLCTIESETHKRQKEYYSKRFTPAQKSYSTIEKE